MRCAAVVLLACGVAAAAKCPVTCTSHGKHVFVTHAGSNSVGAHGPRTAHPSCTGSIGACRASTPIAHTCMYNEDTAKCTCTCSSAGQAVVDHVLNLKDAKEQPKASEAPVKVVPGVTEVKQTSIKAPMRLSDFTASTFSAAAQGAVKIAIAAACGVNRDNVEIVNIAAAGRRRRLMAMATGVSFDVIIETTKASQTKMAESVLENISESAPIAKSFSSLVTAELKKKAINVVVKSATVEAPKVEVSQVKAGCYIKSHSCPNHRWATGKWNFHAHGTKMGKTYCLNDADNHHKSCGGDVMDSWSQKWVDNTGETMVTYPKPGCYWKLEQCPKKPGWVTTPAKGGSATGWKRHHITDQARCVGSAWSHHYFCGLSATQLSSTVFIGDENSREVHLQSYHTVSCGVQSTQKLVPKAAYLSSVHGSTRHRNDVGQKCIDGNGNTMCHSQLEEGWIKIDLGARQFLEHVLVYNRKDCCQSRFGKHVIETSDDGKAWATCFRGTLPASYGPHKETCKARARYVRLRMDGHKNYVNLSEVEVYGKPSCARVGANPGSQVTAGQVDPASISIRP